MVPRNLFNFPILVRASLKENVYHRNYTLSFHVIIIRMKNINGIVLLVIIALSAYLLNPISGSAQNTTKELKTGFQAYSYWSSGLNLPVDIAMVYGSDPKKISSWSERGYAVWSMFGASWLGKNEEIVRQHPEIVQMLPGGVPFEMIPGRAWVVPTEPWRAHIKKIVRGLVAGGARGILPEEPEFFASTGYSASFKSEWRKLFNEPWQAPNSSLTAQWKANRLKSHLFTEFYRDVFQYTKSLDPTIKCLVPVHSNLNYADWNIVSPHHAYYALPTVDGFIGQVWTGTAKHAHPLAGRPLADTFSYSFLEYSYFQNLVAGTNKSAWLLTDPVEDAQGATWDNLKAWYENTVTAALMQPHINTYEVTPWPERVFLNSKTYGGNGGLPIPEDYAAELMAVWAAQRKLPAGKAEFVSGTEPVGVLTADTLMWQRGSGRDRFKGHIAPMLALMRRGIPVGVLPAERFTEPIFPWPNIRIIIASFDAWKPESREIVDSIANWVKRGGTLVYIGGDDDYDDIEGSWWRTDGFDTPADALIHRLLPVDIQKKTFLSNRKAETPLITGDSERRVVKTVSDAPNLLKDIQSFASLLPVTTYNIAESSVWMKTGEKPVIWQARCGAGLLIYAGIPGETFATLPDGDKLFAAIFRAAAETTPDFLYRESNNIILQRDSFIIAHSILGETILTGRFADILNPKEPIKDTITIPEGGNALLLDVDKESAKCAYSKGACILLAAANVSDEKHSESSLEFVLSGPTGRTGYVWLAFKGNTSPKSISYKSHDNSETIIADFGPDWNADTHTLHIAIPLSAEGTKVSAHF